MTQDRFVKSYVSAQKKFICQTLSFAFSKKETTGKPDVCSLFTAKGEESNL